VAASIGANWNGQTQTTLNRCTVADHRFAQRYGMTGAGVQFKNYYFSEKYENCDEYTNHSTAYGRAGSHTEPNEVLSLDVYAT
tara:strand:- start:4661 stop:4909 length:249 start_codon:yes stop_codon:yes gene_type:complete